MRPMDSFEWHKVEELPWPADWAALFGRAAPLVVEIGFGSGLFLADLARRMPQANILGLEISIPSVRNAARKVRRAGLANVCLMQADARSALHALCLPGSIDRVYINYPDPWPKKGHAGRRLIDDEFLELLASRMRPGGELDIATDHDEYAGQIAGCLQRAPHFAGRTDAVYSLDDAGRVVTKYEQVAVAEGRTPRYFKWRRNERAAERGFPIPKELHMPHVVLRLPAGTAEIGQRFRAHAVEVEGMRIRFVEAFQSCHDGKLLIETYINEGPILQRIGLELQPRLTGELVISLAEIGFPRPTRGVHLAIAALVDHLREAYPSLVITQTNLQGEHADIPDKRN